MQCALPRAAYPWTGTGRTTPTPPYSATTLSSAQHSLQVKLSIATSWEFNKLVALIE